MLASLPLYAFPLCMLAAAISDIRKYIIPNTVSIVLIATFVFAFALSGLGLYSLGVHVLTGFATLVICMVLWQFGFLGGGDAKLLAAGALWLSWPVFGIALIFITLAGGALALAVLVVRQTVRWYPRLSLRVPALAKLAATDKPDLTYGVAIAAGSLYVFPQSELFIAFVGG
jgi:prepilin peptidase CpaA